MAKVQKIGRLIFRELTNEESLQRYGSSFVFVGSRPDSLEQAAKAAGDRAVKRLAEERRRGHGGGGDLTMLDRSISPINSASQNF